MKANPENIIDLMFDNKRQYQIPVYQRNYDWKKDNCIELFNDIINAYENQKQHFLGTIVQVTQDDENGIKQYIIIDGQQRTTTIYLLIKALYDSAEMPKDKEELLGYLFNNSSAKEYTISDKNKLKLKPIKSDNDQFVLLMSDKIADMDSTSNVYINYQLFMKLISDCKKRDYSISNIISGMKRLEIVMITLKENADGSGDNPQVVFERINSTGVDLTLADLIRNYVLMTDSNSQYLFDEYWLKMEEMLGKENLVNYFVKYLLFKLPEATAEKNAYPAFKNYVEETKISHEEILKDMLKYANFYNAFICNDQKTYSERITNILKTFKLLKQTTQYPFLFGVFNDYYLEKITEDDLTKVLEFVLNYSLRRLLTNTRTSSLNMFYRSLYKRVYSNGTDDYINRLYKFMATMASTNDKIPNDKSLEEYLLHGDLYKNNILCKYVLTILENRIFDSKEKVVIDSNITIEHIMPQTISKEWKKSLGDNYLEWYESHLNLLGNLSLTGYNSEMSNKPFDEKKSWIIQYSKFKNLNDFVVKSNCWSKEQIITRGQILSRELIKMLQLPETCFASNSEDTKLVYSLQDDIDLTGKTPKSFTIQGETKDSSSFRKIIVNTVEYLLINNESKMAELAKIGFRINDNKRIFITNDKSILREPLEVKNTNIFVEGNISTKASISLLKYLLNEFDIELNEFTIEIKE